MTWISALPDWISAAANVGVAVAAGVAAWQGLANLNAWRKETVERRKIELAELVLAQFYEAQDVFSSIRSPLTYSSENDERQGRDLESADRRRHNDTFFPHLRRIESHREFFAGLRARRYQVIASFGVEAAEPFDEIFQIRADIDVAGQTLIAMGPRDANEDKEDAELRSELEKQVWQIPSNDELGARIEATVGAVEALFRPVLMSKQ